LGLIVFVIGKSITVSMWTCIDMRRESGRAVGRQNDGVESFRSGYLGAGLIDPSTQRRPRVSMIEPFMHCTAMQAARSIRYAAPRAILKRTRLSSLQ